jgi:nitrate/TMAO reductase-like tetraheme cytochrome c subunit
VTFAALAWAAGSPGEGVPQPEGWIGTAEQWAQGLGIALALLNLGVLVLAWRRLRHGEDSRPLHALLFIGLLVLPVVVIFFGYSQGMSGMETVRACGGCHAMTGHVADLRDPDSESLAAVHFKNRYIRSDQCYTCHSDYGLFGTLSAKMDGLRHVVHHVAGTYTTPIKIAHPYSNVRCLTCHAGSQKFMKSDGHPAEIQPQLMSGQESCLTCHTPAHTPKEAKR